MTFLSRAHLPQYKNGRDASLGSFCVVRLSLFAVGLQLDVRLHEGFANLLGEFERVTGCVAREQKLRHALAAITAEAQPLLQAEDPATRQGAQRILAAVDRYRRNRNTGRHLYDRIQRINSA